jgi:Fur family ferric uptake transcriptional regulator
MPRLSEQIVKQLRADGYRITTPRRWVIKTLCESDRHLTVEQIHECLEEADIRVDEATVYRTLQWLKECNYVAQTDIGQGAYVYCLIGDHPHHHLVCLKCNKSIQVDNDVFDSLRRDLMAQHKFKARIDHFAIFGLCEECQDKD